MLRMLVGICWFITVLSIWLPSILKNQFLKTHERNIIKLFSAISAIITICYNITLTR